MKALFLIFHGFSPSNGISKKIHYQVKAMNDCGVNTKLCYLQEIEGSKIRMIDSQPLRNYGSGVRGKILKRIEFKSIVDYVKKEDVKLIYIRSDHNANPFTWWLVYRLRKTGAKVVMEIPTFPYDQEYSSASKSKKIIIDKCFRRLLAKQLNAIITFTTIDKIFGAQTICISNGIDFDQIKLKKQMNNTCKEFHLIGVAEIHYWHGFDRIIQGLVNYYKMNPSYHVYFHIIGDFFGEKEKKMILPLIQENHLEQYVILHGKRYGEELDALFEQADMAIGSLARHRSGITYIKTLKNREYAARGLAFIYSEIDEDFENKSYVMKVSPDETPIDITQLILFYQKQPMSPENIRNSVQYLSWKNQMYKIIKAVE